MSPGASFGGAPRRRTQRVLALAASLALFLAWIVERSLGPPGARASPEAASSSERARRIMAGAVDALRNARIGSAQPRDPSLQPGDSPLLGAETGPLVTTLGSLEAKRLAASPDWAHALATRLRGKGIGEGSFVAASFSGSFPGLNLALISACEALGAHLAAVSSVTASCWGANEPGFTWPEMELLLVRACAIRRASAGVSVGGMGDRGLDLDPEARTLASRIAAAAAAGLGSELIACSGTGEAAAARMSLYEREARGRAIALYVNIGGSEASMGTSAAVLRLRSGFIPGRPFDLSAARGVMARFIERGVPVLSLLNVRDLALRWGVREEGDSK